MNLRNKKIVLWDKINQDRPVWKERVNTNSQEFYVLDPVELFTKVDWTLYEEDVQVINQIYSKLFDEVVIDKKVLVCFWPLAEQFGNDWFELTNLIKHNQFELEIYKQTALSSEYGLTSEILRGWKKLIYFLIESLLEDIRINEQMDEVATLTSEKGYIVLFRFDQNGIIRYSFASSFEYHEAGHDFSQEGESTPHLFDSFDQMLEKLMGEFDLGGYTIKFNDRQLEKTYYNILAKDFKTKNLIQHWLDTYSLN